MAARIVFGLLVMMSGLVHMGNTGGKDTLASVEDFRPGDTLRYTTDGSTPDRTSRFVLYGANEIHITRTTTFKARLYRPGFLPSEVQSHTIYVRDSAETARVVDDEGAPSKEQLFSSREAGCASCHLPLRSQGSEPLKKADSTLTGGS